jgi:chromosome segregation ATPase
MSDELLRYSNSVLDEYAEELRAAKARVRKLEAKLESLQSSHNEAVKAVEKLKPYMAHSQRCPAYIQPVYECTCGLRSLLDAKTKGQL